MYIPYIYIYYRCWLLVSTLPLFQTFCPCWRRRHYRRLRQLVCMGQCLDWRPQKVQHVSLKNPHGGFFIHGTNWTQHISNAGRFSTTFRMALWPANCHSLDSRFIRFTGDFNKTFSVQLAQFHGFTSCARLRSDLFSSDMARCDLNLQH